MEVVDDRISLEPPRAWWLWLTVQLVVVTWDLCYILLRPRTLPGGSLAFLYVPYVLYSTIDLVYGVRNGEFNAFGIGQSLMNIAENACYAYGLVQYRRGKKNLAYVLWFGALVATFSKTVLYALVEVGDDNRNVSHNDWNTFIFLYVLPNNVWTIVPGFFVFFVFGPALVHALNSGKTRTVIVSLDDDEEDKKAAKSPRSKSPRAASTRSRSPRRKAQ